MKIKIFHSKDSMFRLIRNISDIDKEKYSLAYQYDKDYAKCKEVKDILEEVFDKFNVNMPRDYRNRSLCSGDIINLDSDYYLCKSIGWLKLDEDIIKRMCI